MVEILKPKKYIKPTLENAYKVNPDTIGKTLVTFYSDPRLPDNYSDVIEFKSYKEVDDYLEPFKILEVFTTYQREENQVRILKKLESIRYAKFIRIENYTNSSDKYENIIYYGHINRVSYLTKSTTTVDWALDPWYTYTPILDLWGMPRGQTFVERAHEPDVNTGPNGTLRTINNNPEPLSRQPVLVDSKLDDIIYTADHNKPNNNDIRAVMFAVYWVTRNIDENGNNTTSNFPGDGLFVGAPSMSQAFIIPYDSESGRTISWEYGGTTYPGGEEIFKVMGKLAVAKDINGSRTVTNAYFTDFFGLDFEFKNGVIGFRGTGDLKDWSATWKVPGTNTTSLVPLMLLKPNFRWMKFNKSPLEYVMDAQNKALSDDGIKHKVRNIKTSSGASASIRLLDGAGNSFEYNPELINIDRPSDPMRVVFQSGLTMEHKTHAFIDNYNHHNNFAPASVTNSDLEKAVIENGGGIWNNSPNELPIVSDTFSSQNALNQNSNKMVYKSADIQRQNMQIGQENAQANQNLGIDAGNQQMNNNINTARGQSDLQSGAYIGNMFGLDRGTSNVGAGTFNGMVNGAMSGLAGGFGGALIGGVTGGLTGGYKQGINYASQEMGYSNQQANQSISNNAQRAMLANSQNAQTAITDNNIQLSIDAFNAKQADLRNAPDQYIQSGGSGLWVGQFQQHWQFLTVKTESGAKIRMTDLYYSAFGYSIGQYLSQNKFKRLTHTRMFWNFVKTSGIMISDKHLPAHHARALEGMFNNGIRIWHTANGKLVTTKTFMDIDNDNPHTIGDNPYLLPFMTYSLAFTEQKSLTTPQSDSDFLYSLVKTVDN